MDGNASIVSGRLLAFRLSLTRIRERRGLSQKSLAHRTGLSAHSISDYEQGVSAPRLDALVKLCVELGVAPDELLGWPTGLSAARMEHSE